MRGPHRFGKLGTIQAIRIMAHHSENTSRLTKPRANRPHSRKMGMEPVTPVTVQLELTTACAGSKWLPAIQTICHTVRRGLC